MGCICIDYMCWCCFSFQRKIVSGGFGNAIILERNHIKLGSQFWNTITAPAFISASLSLHFFARLPSHPHKSLFQVIYFNLVIGIREWDNWALDSHTSFFLSIWGEEVKLLYHSFNTKLWLASWRRNDILWSLDSLESSHHIKKKGSEECMKLRFLPICSFLTN